MSKAEMPELLPCLRCGGPSEIVPRWSDHPSLAGYPPTYSPVCRHCGLTSGGCFDSPEYAEKWWNYRADTARAQIRREVVEEIDTERLANKLDMHAQQREMMHARGGDFCTSQKDFFKHILDTALAEQEANDDE